MENENDRREVQNNIDKLMKWVEVWQNFNTTKFKMIHMGPSNKGFVYTMGGY